MHIGLPVKYQVFLSNCNKAHFSWQIFEKYSISIFHENPSIASRVVSCGRIMTELIIAFRNFVGGSKMMYRRKITNPNFLRERETEMLTLLLLLLLLLLLAYSFPPRDHISTHHSPRTLRCKQAPRANRCHKTAIGLNFLPSTQQINVEMWSMQN